MSNEGRLCDAAVKSIERRTGEKRIDIRWPERDRIGPPVELRLKIGTQEYAIEHTLIEAFEGEIGGWMSLERIAGPIKKALCGKLPGPAYYDLSFPSEREPKVHKSDLKKHQEKLKEWVLTRAPLLYWKIQRTMASKSQDVIKATPCGFSFEIQLSCVVTGPFSAREPGLIKVSRWIPENLRALTKCRLRRALRKKLPKLLDCKSEGARSVLVLESDDAITDADPVGNALVKLQEEFDGELAFPDEIYFAKTSSNETTWSIWCMKYSRQLWSWEDLTKSTSFRVDELTDLTCREKAKLP